MENMVFARIVDGRIAEYPVYALHIKNRAHPMDWYTPVIYLQKPAYDDRCQSIQEELQITGNYVVATYKVLPLTVNSALDKLFYPNGRVNMLNPIEAVEPAVVTIASIDPFLFGQIMERASYEVGQTLDAFARTRNYDDVKSCSTYVNSTNTQFQAEANRIIALRDQTYTNLYSYLATVTAGTNPLPKSFDEIKTTAALPELTWS